MKKTKKHQHPLKTAKFFCVARLLQTAQKQNP